MDVPLLVETPEVFAHRAAWQHRGERRPAFAIEPGPGQESVWDYPRPPRLEKVRLEMEVQYRGVTLAQTTNGVRVCETAGAPTYYFPPWDVVAEFEGDGGSSLCEWKGLAEGLSLPAVSNAAWRYIQMYPAFAELYNWVAFYPTRVDCYLGGEAVTPQPGGYYGGWVTRNIVGPIKGEPGISG